MTKSYCLAQSHRPDQLYGLVAWSDHYNQQYKAFDRTSIFFWKSESDQIEKIELLEDEEKNRKTKNIRPFL